MPLLVASAIVPATCVPWPLRSTGKGVVVDEVVALDEARAGEVGRAAEAPEVAVGDAGVEHRDDARRGRPARAACDSVAHAVGRVDAERASEVPLQRCQPPGDAADAGVVGQRDGRAAWAIVVRRRVRDAAARGAAARSRRATLPGRDVQRSRVRAPARSPRRADRAQRRPAAPRARWRSARSRRRPRRARRRAAGAAAVRAAEREQHAAQRERRERAAATSSVEAGHDGRGWNGAAIRAASAAKTSSAAERFRRKPATARLDASDP